MSWKSVIGQARAKNILRTTIQRGRLAHAYLFSGADGAGMDAAAFELAKVVNCDLKSDEACDTCSSCRAVREFRHPDVNLIVALPVGKGEKSGDEPLAKLSEDDVILFREEMRTKSANPYYDVHIPRATTIKINSVRQIRVESSRSMFGEGKRVFILIGAESLNVEAGNALLKILEEPHEDTMLVLTTSRPAQLLPTIQSRCQQILFDPLGAAEIEAALEEREHLSKDDAALLASLASGSYGRALALNGAAIREERNDAVGFLRVSLYKSNRELLDEIDRLLSEYERAGIAGLLAILEAWLRDAQLVGEGGGKYQSGLDRETVEKFAAHHRDVRFEAVFGALADAISLLGKNVYIPLILITLALTLRENILSPSEQNGRAASAPAGNVPVSPV